MVGREPDRHGRDELSRPSRASAASRGRRAALSSKPRDRHGGGNAHDSRRRPAAGCIRARRPGRYGRTGPPPRTILRLLTASPMWSRDRSRSSSMAAAGSAARARTARRGRARRQVEMRSSGRAGVPSASRMVPEDLVGLRVRVDVVGLHALAPVAITIETEPFGPMTSFTKKAVSLIIGPQPASYQPTDLSSKVTCEVAVVVHPGGSSSVSRAPTRVHARPAWPA